MNDLPSPTSGGVPPALSPLDALALRGRLLAQEFDRKNSGGRRISRLPPLTIANEFGNRPDFFRSISGESTNSQSLPFQDEPDEPEFQEEHTPQSARETRPDNKHKSFYPQIQSDEAPYEKTFPFRNNLSKVDEGEQPVPNHQDYFAISRTHSPMPAEPRIGPVQEATPVTPGSHLGQNATYPFTSKQAPKQSTLAIDSVAARGYGSNALQPPRSPAPSRSPRVSPSIRSVPGDSSDEVEGMSLGGSYDSLPRRQMSTNSSFSHPYSPGSPFINNSIPRSPSISSEYSVGGTQLPRPAFNFSRPLSSASRPSFDIRPSFEGPSRQTSDESAMMRPSFDSSRQYANDSPLTNYSNDVVHTPVSMTSEDFRRSSDSQNHPVPAYTYSRFDLPRGREPQRESINAADFLNKQIQWDQPQNGNGPSNAPTSRTRPPSPPSPPRSMDRPRSQPAPPAAVSRTSSAERHGAPSLTSSNSTIRPNRPTGSGEVTAEQHLDRGIACHEAGSLKESTYHLRLAAKAGLPTGMLLYALACRHGWGMRKNEAEGVSWLRRAVDIAQLEVAEDEDQTKQGKPSDIMERKTHKAQFAYSIYELAQSYANGWGIQQDKTLALRCYEIAGNWGDPDALTEAGFCYAQGVGCKKDMKKAAKFYRMAEAKGVSMAGNSWQEKYMDDASSDARSTRSGRSSKKDTSEKKPRDKSRTRTIFGRKKSFAT
ncbi:uncharacterized protein BDZ99DRAFT_448035 [Mytilinidion resinicola]|uniref:HCP-like protein n=1 Tax=Mytilinidion resinicola TaxID=574789 RepID=A0A6A6YFH2_9PEZI|nr:uncharacterized protein BDZ99DRAFT_448035 [Mytilinidion resinicola]KAF2806627.1 hypothetical protein BDZ99DRAFT_448035 [Mytilinidion resinicola]